jgi:hypothetical protein
VSVQGITHSADLSPEELREKIKRSLTAAIVGNGHDEMREWTARNIAPDLILFDADFEDMEVDVLEPHVAAVMWEFR